MHSNLTKIFRYVFINSIFAVCIYYGFFEGVDGARNVAVFMGWITATLAVLILLATAVDENKMLEAMARHDTPIPWLVDLAFDLCVLTTFVWYGHYMLALFYATSIYAGKMMRDASKNFMLKQLKSQGGPGLSA